MAASPARHNQVLRQTFRHEWKAWQNVVRLFAGKHEDRFHVKAKDYELLHNDLLNVCRRLRFTREPDARVFKSIAELIEPWVNLSALEDLESERLWKLLEECQQESRKLRHWGLSTTGWIIVAAAAASVGGMLFVFALGAVDAVPEGLGYLADLKFRIASVARAIEYSSTKQRLLATGVVAAVVTILLARSRKSY